MEGKKFGRLPKKFSRLPEKLPTVFVKMPLLRKIPWKWHIDGEKLLRLPNVFGNLPHFFGNLPKKTAKLSNRFSVP